MELITDGFGIFGIVVGIGALLNENKLRKRLNNLEDILLEKNVISKDEIVKKILNS